MCSTESPLDALASALERLGAQDVAGFAVPPEELVALRGLVDRAEAEFTRRLTAFDAAAGWQGDGAVSGVAWARAHLRMTAGAARERLRTGQTLRDLLPAVGAAFAAGELSLAHAQVLARGVSATRACQAAAVEAEPVLLEAARRLDPRQLRAVVEHWGAAIDPGATVGDALAVRERRYLAVSPTYDGMVALDGLLPPIEGTALLTALDAAGQAIRTPNDDRTAQQLRADALAHLVERTLAGAALPSTGGERPQVRLVLGLSAVRDAVGGQAHLDRHGPISAWTALRLLCDASVIPVLVDDTRPGTSEPLDIGRARKDPTPAQRRAVRLRDGGCRFAGCDRPADWCDVHHLLPWSHGGRTDLHNLALLCSQHHHTIHDHGYRMTRGPDGTFHTHRPDGTEIPDHARGPSPLQQVTAEWADVGATG
jgi:hypothetical protein